MQLIAPSVQQYQQQQQSLWSTKMDSSSSSSSAPSYVVGEVVYVGGEGDWRGRICYIGEVHFAKGEWAGVALDHPLGTHDGCVRGGRRYFQCGADHGIFVRVNRLSRTAVVPMSMDPAKIGLLRQQQMERAARIMREESPSALSTSSSVYSNGSGSRLYTSNNYYGRDNMSSGGGGGARSSSSREGSPFSSSGRRISFNDETNFRRSASPQLQQQQQQQEYIPIGSRVIVASSVGETKTGILRYMGPVAFAEGEWAGIELFHPLGKNDGTVRGRQYFVCEHPYGLFVPKSKVEYSPANKTLGRRLGTRDNLFAIQQSTGGSRAVRAGSYDDYY